MRSIAGGIVLLLMIGASLPAAADAVDDAIIELTAASSDYKVRLSAVAKLAKIGDVRAVRPLIKALHLDKDRVVRGASANSLGKIGGRTSASVKQRIISALSRASRFDRDSFVKKQATRALSQIGSSAPVPSKP